MWSDDDKLALVKLVKKVEQDCASGGVRGSLTLSSLFV